MANIQVFFHHKVLSIDFDSQVMSVRNVDAGKDISVLFDFCVGADGSYSIVRRQLMRVVRYVVPYRVVDNVIFPSTSQPVASLLTWHTAYFP